MLKIMSRVLLLKIIRMNRLLPYIRNRVGVLVLILVAMSCTGNDIYLPDSGAKDYPVSLNAGYPGPDTRLSVDGTVVGWDKDNDKIRIVAASADKKTGTSELTVYKVSNNGKTASFTGFVSMESMPEVCYFMYPVHNSMTVNPETEEISVPYNNQSGKHEPFMYAKTAYSSEGITKTLSHIGAMLEITCKIEDVQQLTFAGNELEPLSPVIVNSVTGTTSVAKEENVQITVPVQTEGKTYIAVPPVNMEKGFSIICSNTDGSKNMIKTFSSDGKLGSGYDFSSEVGHIIPITLEGTLEDYEVTSSEPVVTHTKTTEGLLNGTSVTFIMSKKGVSDKLIEEWGATLVNSDKEIVRKIEYTNIYPPKGQVVTMDVANSWKLLPSGTYTFAPYYKIYGQLISLPSQNVTVEDPGVKLEIHGQTSYDKYLNKDIKANTLENRNLISDMSVSVNLDPSIIDNLTVDFNNKEIVKSKSDLKSGEVYIGSYTKDEPKAYPFVVKMEVGKLEFSKSKDFHVTGLPMEINFQTSSLYDGWTHNNVKIEANHYRFPEGSSSVISPKFHIPEETKASVSMKAYAYRGWLGSPSLMFYIDATSEGAVQSGVDKEFSGGDGTDPNNQEGESMSGGITFTPKNNKLSIMSVSSKNGAWTGVISFGLYAKKFKVEYSF